MSGSLEVPPLDHTLLYDAELKATGANIHAVANAIVLYTNEHDLATRRSTKGTLTADYIDRINEFERNLRLVIRSL